MSVMQGLRTLYGHARRTDEWRRLVDELIPDMVDPVTDGPLPGREDLWSLFTSYRADLAQDGRDWASAQRLQHALVDWGRQQTATALGTPTQTLDNDQRERVRTLAINVEMLGHLLREQGDPGCVRHYKEAIRLFRRIGARWEESDVAYNLGNAYLHVPALHDLDQAQEWYETGLELRDPGDRLGRAAYIAQLGRICLVRFDDAHAAGAPTEELSGHLNAAATSCHEAIELLPKDAVPQLAGVHDLLGDLYQKRGALDTALAHYRKAIYYEELCGNRYGAGGTRYNVAGALRRAGRLGEALLYAKAALRDFEQVGAGATARIDAARKLVAYIEQELAGGESQGG